MTNGRFCDTKWFDLLAASPLIAFYGFAIRGLTLKIAPHFHQLAASFDGALSITSQVATMTFLGVQIVLFAIRRVPLAKARGIVPRMAAIFGANLQLLFLAVPQVEQPVPLKLASLAIIIGGTALSIYVACRLGRSFSVLPQARALVTSGPYRRIRHPLYLAEQIATFGAMFQFAQPWSLLVALASFAVQFPRMHYEEEILSESFPAYRAYMARTARLIPGVY